MPIMENNQDDAILSLNGEVVDQEILLDSGRNTTYESNTDKCRDFFDEEKLLSESSLWEEHVNEKRMLVA